MADPKEPRKGSYQYVVSPDGETLVQRYGVDKTTGEGSWYTQKDPNGDPLKDVPANKGMDGKTLRYSFNAGQQGDYGQQGPTAAEEAWYRRAQVSKAKAKQRVQELHDRGYAAQQRAEEARNMGFFKKLMLSTGQETNKLVEGTKDLNNIIGKAAGDPQAARLMAERKTRMADLDASLKEFNEEKGVAGVLGESVPYLLTGMVANPVTRKVAEKVGGGIGALASKLSNLRHSGVAKVADKMSDSGSNALQGMGKDLQEGYLKKSQMDLDYNKNKVVYGYPNRPDLIKDLIGDTALGAVEGAAHYDMGAGQGAANSAIGSWTGSMLKPLLSNRPKAWNPSEQSLVDWSRAQGMTHTPGMQTGSAQLQKFEKGVQQSGDTTDLLGRVDRGNQEVMNRTAWKSAGIENPKNAFAIDQDVLNKHKANLKQQYNDLEAASTAYIEVPAFQSVMSDALSLQSNNSPGARQAYQTLEKYLNRIRRGGETGDSGELTGLQISGRDYQVLRSQLKEELKSASKNNQPFLPKHLRGVIRMLDEGLDSGMRRDLGDASADQWKKLNEQYAMTKLIINHGSDINGNFDARKLGQHLMSTDAERTLMGEGSEAITNLQKLAKIDHMVRNQSGSGLAGSNVRPFSSDGQLTPVQAFMSTPMGANMPFLTRKYMENYVKGRPSVTGLLNLSGEGVQDFVRYNRAVHQAYEPYEKGISLFDQFINGGEEQQKEEEAPTLLPRVL